MFVLMLSLSKHEAGTPFDYSWIGGAFTPLNWWK